MKKFMAGRFLVAKTGKQTKSPFTGEGMHKLRYRQSMEWHTAQEAELCLSTWLHLRNNKKMRRNVL